MKSKLAEALGLEFPPVVLVWTDAKPEAAVEFGPGRWGCVMFHLAAAARGRTAVIGRDSFGCPGGGVGLGFGNRYLDFPGGVDSFYRFLSEGNEGDPLGKGIGEAMAASGNQEMAEEFLLGERYMKDADCARRFVEEMPITDIPAKYVVLRPMTEGDLDNKEVRSITLLVNPDQLSALVVMANYEHPERENVGIPFAAGCQVIGIFMYREREREIPRALVGLTDLSARKNVGRILGKDKMTFSMTPEMFKRMEGNFDGSFFQRHTWQALGQASMG